MPDFNQKHETHKETFLKFTVLLLILVLYFIYMGWKYGTSTGISVSILTWTFFVLCTPVADAGFILAFPIRLLFKIKMSITQAVLWFLAVAINIVMLSFNPSAYDLTFITQLLKHILIQPYPYWSILIISAIGTFLSIFFGDEMMDVRSHKNCNLQHKHGFKYRTILVLGLGILTVLSYYYLLNSLNVEIPN